MIEAFEAIDRMKARAEMDEASKENDFQVAVFFDSRPLEKNIERLLEFKSSVLEGVFDQFVGESFHFMLNFCIDNRNVIFCKYDFAMWAGLPNKIICVLDFNVVQFFREWLATMRTHDFYFDILHIVSLFCRGI